MRAVPFFSHGSADVLEYREDFPDPARRAGQVAVDVEYCGVNHLDIWTRMGISGKKIRLPHLCGCDVVGKTKSGGAVLLYPGFFCGRCSYCRAGRENLCSQFAIIGGMSDYNGGYAEKVVVPARNIIPLPRSMKREHAATLAVSYLTAWNMLMTNGASRGKTVLVYGASSGVGMATIQLAKALGAVVITTVSGGDKREFAEKLGADHVIDRRSQNVVEEAVRHSKGGVDIAIDHVGAATWQTSLAALRKGGRMAVCGMTSGNDATIEIRAFYTKQIIMTGALLGTRRQLYELLRIVTKKKIIPMIDSILPLSDAAKAHQKVEAGRQMGKILLKCR